MPDDTSPGPTLTDFLHAHSDLAKDLIDAVLSKRITPDDAARQRDVLVDEWAVRLGVRAR